MGKAAELTKRFGQHINESIGLRSTTSANRSTPPNDFIPVATKDSGRKRFRQAGIMQLDRIIPDPNQPRKEFPAASLASLSKSIKKFGILQPIVIRWNADEEKHIIVSGERRYRASKLAGLTEIPAIFSEDGEIPEAEILLRQLTENIQRDELSPMEAARSFDELRTKEGWSSAQIAEALSISKAVVIKRLSLLKLPADLQHKVHKGTLSGSHGYHITKMGDEHAQREFAAKIQREQLTRDEAAQVAGKKSRKKLAHKPGRPVTKEHFRLDCGAKVTLTFHKKHIAKSDRIKAAEQFLSQVTAA